MSGERQPYPIGDLQFGQKVEVTKIVDIPQIKPVTFEDLVIPNGASVSDVFEIGSQLSLIAIIMPASWTAANLTFQAAAGAGGTYNNVYDDAGTELTVTAAASRFISLNPRYYVGMTNIKVRSGTAGTPVAQEASRTLKLVLRSVE